jgi:hypothetical protein
MKWPREATVMIFREGFGTPEGSLAVCSAFASANGTTRADVAGYPARSPARIANFNKQMQSLFHKAQGAAADSVLL